VLILITLNIVFLFSKMILLFIIICLGLGATGMNRAGSSTGFYIFENEEELQKLFLAAGFDPETLAVRREGRGCAIIKATKSINSAKESVPVSSS